MKKDNRRNIKKKKNIVFSILVKTFPGFIWVDRVLEMCGWNPKTFQWIIIDDGLCRDEDGQWMVHIYQLSSSDKPLEDDYKYMDFDQKIEEKWYKLA